MPDLNPLATYDCVGGPLDGRQLTIHAGCSLKVFHEGGVVGYYRERQDERGRSVLQWFEGADA